MAREDPSSTGTITSCVSIIASRLSLQTLQLFFDQCLRPVCAQNESPERKSSLVERRVRTGARRTRISVTGAPPSELTCGAGGAKSREREHERECDADRRQSETTNGAPACERRVRKEVATTFQPLVSSSEETDATSETDAEKRPSPVPAIHVSTGDTPTSDSAADKPPPGRQQPQPARQYLLHKDLVATSCHS